MDYKEASAIVDQAIKRIMERDGLTYDRAFDVLAREKPDLIRAWEAVRSRYQKRRGAR